MATAWITCVTIARYSTISISIAGPDIVPAIFLGAMARTIEQRVGNDEDAAVSTLIFMVLLSTLCMTATWLLMAHYKLSRLLDYLPISVVSGFLASIGYELMKKAVKMSVGYYKYDFPDSHFWMLLSPAIPLGLSLYYLKKYHIGDPVVLLSCYLIGPVILFYLIAWGEDLDNLRYEGWLYEETEYSLFWHPWTHFHLNKIDPGAIFACLPNLAILVVLTVIDSLLQITTTKTELKAGECDPTQELWLYGWMNIPVLMFFGAPGYGNVKFNLLNYAILDNKDDRRPGYGVALLCAIYYFIGFPVISYLPRFFLGGFLIYAAMPFIESHLFLSYNRVTKKEFASIWVIMLTNAITSFYTDSGLLLAVIVGIIFAALIFMTQYSEVSIIREQLDGSVYRSKRVRSYQEERLLTHLGVRFYIVELQGFIFFGTASQLLTDIKTIIIQNVELPFARRVRYMALDFKHVENIDYSGSNSFVDGLNLLTKHHIAILVTGMNNNVRDKLKPYLSDQFPHIKTFGTLDLGAECVEEELLERAVMIRQKWLVCDSFKKLHTQASLKATFEVNDNFIFLFD